MIPFYNEEGINGHYHSYDMEEGGEYDSCYTKSKLFKRDKYYYHKYLLEHGELATIEYETEKTYLIKCEKGLFWLPKKLLYKNEIYGKGKINNWKVHKCFQRTYLTEQIFITGEN